MGLSKLLPGSKGLSKLLPGSMVLSKLLPGSRGLSKLLPGSRGLIKLLPGSRGLRSRNGFPPRLRKVFPCISHNPYSTWRKKKRDKDLHL